MLLPCPSPEAFALHLSSLRDGRYRKHATNATSHISDHHASPSSSSIIIIIIIKIIVVVVVVFIHHHASSIIAASSCIFIESSCTIVHHYVLSCNIMQHHAKSSFFDGLYNIPSWLQPPRRVSRAAGSSSFSSSRTIVACRVGWWYLHQPNKD